MLLIIGSLMPLLDNKWNTRISGDYPPNFGANYTLFTINFMKNVNNVIKNQFLFSKNFVDQINFLLLSGLSLILAEILGFLVSLAFLSK